MPELPEVETVVRGLRARLPGRRIFPCGWGRPISLRSAALGERLPGDGALLSNASANSSASSWLGANGERPANGECGGRLALARPPGHDRPLCRARAGEPVVPHTHGLFELDDGKELRYTDIRRFGRMLLVPARRLPEFQVAG